MNRIKEDFKANMPTAAVGAAWFNSVAKFINGLTGGHGISIQKDGDIPTIELDPSADLGYSRVVPNVKLQSGGQGDDDAVIAARHPKDVKSIPASESASEKQTREIQDLGTSNLAARSDHQHRLSSDMGDDPIDNTQVSAIGDDPEAQTLSFTDWESGGDDGVKLRLYALVDADTYSGGHVLQPIDIEIAANGLVKSVSSPAGDLGVFIGG